MDSGPRPSLRSHTWWPETWGPIQENAFYVNVLREAPPAWPRVACLRGAKDRSPPLFPPTRYNMVCTRQATNKMTPLAVGGPVHCTMASITLASTNYTAVPAASMWQSKLSKCQLGVTRPPDPAHIPAHVEGKEKINYTHINNLTIVQQPLRFIGSLQSAKLYAKHFTAIISFNPYTKPVMYISIL